MRLYRHQRSSWLPRALYGPRIGKFSAPGGQYRWLLHQSEVTSNESTQKSALIRSDQYHGSHSCPSCQICLRWDVMMRYLLDSPAANACVHQPKDNIAPSTGFCDKCQPSSSSSSSSHLHLATSEAPSHSRRMGYQALGLLKPSSFSILA